jgi:hypothetical protein
MAKAKAKAAATSSEPYPDQSLPEFQPHPPDIGDAAAGEGDYASPPVAEWPADDRPAEEQAGTPEHLGDAQPYAGPSEE